MEQKLAEKQPTPERSSGSDDRLTWILLVLPFVAPFIAVVMSYVLIILLHATGQLPPPHGG